MLLNIDNVLCMGKITKEAKFEKCRKSVTSDKSVQGCVGLHQHILLDFNDRQFSQKRKYLKFYLKIMCDLQ